MNLEINLHHMTALPNPLMFTALPSDILILILQSVSVRELASLSGTCRLLNSLVTEFGWVDQLRARSRPSSSLSQTRKLWQPKTQVRYDFLADRAWSLSEFIARPLSRMWTERTQPVLSISPSRLVIAAGPSIISYRFGVAAVGAAPPICLEGAFSFASQHISITSITFVEDGGLDETLCIGFQDGSLHQVSLIPPSHHDTASSLGASTTTFSQLQEGEFVESLSSHQHLLLALSSSGNATLTNLHSLASPDVVALNTRSWVSHLCTDASGPYAAFGTSSMYPLRVHSITNDGMSQTPFAVLHTDMNFDVYKPTSSAVYGISRGPLASPWGASPQILVSGWFDGQVRCYDLRSSSRSSAVDGESHSVPLRPVLAMHDPLQMEAIYSVSCGGGSSSHVAAGSARHSVVSFWDIRSPKTGWSVHAPHNDRSPVYSVILESSRLFGATHSRPFLFDFGPDVDIHTYPSLPERKKGGNGIGYYVTKYPHATRSAY